MTRALKLTPIPVTLAILSFMCPSELSLVLGDLRLSPHRVVFLLFFPFALFRLLSPATGGIRSYDIAIILLAFWLTAVFGYHEGMDGVIFGGSLALESLGGYLIARAYIRDLETLTATVQLMFASVVIVALLASLDTLTQGYFVHNVLTVVGSTNPIGSIDFRNGIIRAAGTFDHPIHYGTYCAATFALIWAATDRGRTRLFRATVVGISVLLALSSAPLLSLGLQIGMLIWDRVTRGVALRTQITIAVLVGLYLGMGLVSRKSPIELLIVGATFDPWTGIYRMMIWTYGLENIWSSPWVGIGLADWQRPAWMVASTIDAYWIVLPLRSGIPALLLLATALILLGRQVGAKAIRGRDPERRRVAIGWTISLIAFCLMGATVHFWNVPHAMFYFFIGLGGALADPLRSTVTSKTAATAPAVRRRRHPSFGPYPGRGVNNVTY